MNKKADSNWHPLFGRTQNLYKKNHLYWVFDCRYLLWCGTNLNDVIQKKLLYSAWYTLTINVSSYAFVLKLCGFDPSVVHHTPHIIHCGNYIVMLVLLIAGFKLLLVDSVVVVVVVDDVDDDGEDGDDDNDRVEWCLLCAFFPCQGNQLDKARLFWLTAPKYIHAVFVWISICTYDK